MPQLREVLLLRHNVDCLQLAHDISSSQWSVKALPKVALLNGASRKLVGNHWFQGGARYAIDENLHRRSASMARAALLLNLNTEPIARRPWAMANHVMRWGGQVFRASDGKKLFVDTPDAAGTSAGLRAPPAQPQKKAERSSRWCCCCRRRRQK